MNVAARRILGRLHSRPLRYPREKRGSRRFGGRESLTLRETIWTPVFRGRIRAPPHSEASITLRISDGLRSLRARPKVCFLPQQTRAGGVGPPPSPHPSTRQKDPCASCSVTPRASIASLALNLDEVRPFSFPSLSLFAFPSAFWTASSSHPLVFRKKKKNKENAFPLSYSQGTEQDGRSSPAFSPL